jgi:hypothetical protein
MWGAFPARAGEAFGFGLIGPLQTKLLYDFCRGKHRLAVSLGGADGESEISAWKRVSKKRQTRSGMGGQMARRCHRPGPKASARMPQGSPREQRGVPHKKAGPSRVGRLRLEDLDLDNCVVEVRQSVWRNKVQTPKTPNALRQFAISPQLTAHLQKFLADLAAESNWGCSLPHGTASLGRLARCAASFIPCLTRSASSVVVCIHSVTRTAA